MHELRDEPEPSLAQLLRRVSPCDLILVEGYKHGRHPKLEVYRPVVGKPPLYVEDARVLAVATDAPLTGVHPPVVDLNDSEAVATRILDCAASLPRVLAALQGGD
jgi:molybdopterin-guanine dinucleotide biosynthesis protein B